MGKLKSMGRRYLKLGDKSTAGGIVIEGIPSMKHHGTELTFIGAQVNCPACKSVGRIAPQGARSSRLMGLEAALEGDICVCKCSTPPRMIGAQNSMFESSATNEAASTGFVPASSSEPKALVGARSSFSASAKPVGKQWVKFSLNETGSCEGLRCAAHFSDGSVEHGTFDAENVVHFDRPNNSPCNKVEILFDKAGDTSGSVLDSLLNAMTSACHE